LTAPSERPGDEPASRAPRRPTADPRRFLVPEEHLPPGFASRVESGGFEPVPAGPASTVVLARDAEEGLEVLMLRRPQRSGFAAGAWVFPGGRVDPADSDPDVASLVTGPPAAEWARRLGVTDPDEARGYVVAALREAWEETAILVGRAGAGPRLLDEARERLLAGEWPLARALQEAEGRLDAGDLLYIAHWITPEPEPRRFDTRFFLARVASDAECRLSGEELAEARWFAPAAAVEGFTTGELTLLPPTVDTLRRLARHPTLDSAWSELRNGHVSAILPRMRREPGGVVIEF
jgi:8-oxo-dGTP pyrophosphatase MutT (NUDIX family)